MVTEEHIGEWATRWKINRTTRSHLIQSRVADRFITKCGREMRLATHDGQLVFGPNPEADAVCEAGCVPSAVDLG